MIWLRFVVFSSGVIVFGLALVVFCLVVVLFVIACVLVKGPAVLLSSTLAVCRLVVITLIRCFRAVGPSLVRLDWQLPSQAVAMILVEMEEVVTAFSALLEVVHMCLLWHLCLLGCGSVTAELERANWFGVMS